MSQESAFRYAEMWNALYEIRLGSINRWIDARKIPVATLLPYESYNGKVPEEDIVTIPFDPLDMENTARQARNILILGGSGDGKSLIAKSIWWFLHYAGYYCIYVDPKSTDSGRAIKPWKEDILRIAPDTDPIGIQLKHYVPPWALKPEHKHIEHNFSKYSTKLSMLDNMEIWQTLGMTMPAASKTARVIREHNDARMPITIKDLMKYYTFLLEDEEEDGFITKASIDSALRILVEINEFRVVDDKIPTLNLIEEWESGNSICISYNSASSVLMAFDVGQKIKESAMTFFDNRKRPPIMWFFDDAGYYARHSGYGKYNMAVDEIRKIGNDYRSLGVYNCLMIQSLNILDQTIADTYKLKFLSPLFEGIDALGKIGIPKHAIDMLRSEQLVIDKKNALLQWIHIDEDKNTIPCFPLTPPCNHFRNVLTERYEGEEI